MSPYSALAIGRRRVLGLTCHRCGHFRSSSEFKRYRRARRDKIEYIDRRCLTCRWGHLNRAGGVIHRLVTRT